MCLFDFAGESLERAIDILDEGGVIDEIVCRAKDETENEEDWTSAQPDMCVDVELCTRLVLKKIVAKGMQLTENHKVKSCELAVRHIGKKSAIVFVCFDLGYVHSLLEMYY